MDELCFYRSAQFAYPFAGLFNPMRGFESNYAITGSDGDKNMAEKKRREKKRMSQIMYSDNRRQRLNERLRLKLENRKTNEDTEADKTTATKDAEFPSLSEKDLLNLFKNDNESSQQPTPPKKKKKRKKKRKKKNKNNENARTAKPKPDTKEPTKPGAAVPQMKQEEVISAKVEDTTETSEVKDDGRPPTSPVVPKDTSPPFEISTSDEHIEISEPLELEQKEANDSSEEGSTTQRTPSPEGDSGEILTGVHDSGESRRTSVEKDLDAKSVQSSTGDSGPLLSPSDGLEEMTLGDDVDWHLFMVDREQEANQKSLEETIEQSFRDDGFTVVKKKEKRVKQPKSRSFHHRHNQHHTGSPSRSSRGYHHHHHRKHRKDYYQNHKGGNNNKTSKQIKSPRQNNNNVAAKQQPQQIPIFSPRKAVPIRNIPSSKPTQNADETPTMTPQDSFHHQPQPESTPQYFTMPPLANPQDVQMEPISQVPPLLHQNRSPPPGFDPIQNPEGITTFTPIPMMYHHPHPAFCIENLPAHHELLPDTELHLAKPFDSKETQTVMYLKLPDSIARVPLCPEDMCSNLDLDLSYPGMSAYPHAPVQTPCAIVVAGPPGEQFTPCYAFPQGYIPAPLY